MSVVVAVETAFFPAARGEWANMRDESGHVLKISCSVNPPQNKPLLKRLLKRRWQRWHLSCPDINLRMPTSSIPERSTTNARSFLLLLVSQHLSRQCPRPEIFFRVTAHLKLLYRGMTRCTITSTTDKYYSTVLHNY